MTEQQIESFADLPVGMYQANRYDTDNEHVLTLWADGKTWDIRRDRADAEEGK